MIRQLAVTNHIGETLVLELRSPEKSGLFILNIDGLEPPSATLNMTESALIDGKKFNSARANARNILLNLAFGWPIEDARRKTYKYFPVKQRVELEITTDDRVCRTYGYVESNEVKIFTNSAGTTISIICPEPFFTSNEQKTTIFSGVEPMFEFPFSNESLTESLLIMSEISINRSRAVAYSGDVPVGFVIHMHAMGTVVNPKIINSKTKKFILVDTVKLAADTGTGFIAGDDIIISTISGKKSVTLVRDGVSYNIINYLEKDPSWFELEIGTNTFAYTADSGVLNIQFKIVNDIAYAGV